MHLRKSLFPAIAVLALAACNTQPSEEPVPPEAEASETPSPRPTESVSILRPDIAPPSQETEDAILEPLEATVGFPEGGSELDADAVAKLEEILSSPQMALDGPITLRAHSDSNGTDVVNLDASEERGLAVAEWFVENGVDSDRITVVAFGEQNPAQPNALPDGSPNDDGRAANRRVEIEVQTLMLTVSTIEADGSTEAGD